MPIPEHIISRLNELNCAEVADALGLQVRNHKCKCFLHEENNPSLHFHRNGHFWHCFSCNKGGGAIKLVMEYHKLGYKEACEWLCYRFGIYWDKQTHLVKAIPTLKSYISKTQNKEEVAFNAEIGAWLLENAALTIEAKAFLYDERKINAEVVEKQGLKALTDRDSVLSQFIKKFDKDELIKSGWLIERDGNLWPRMFTPCLLIPYFDREDNLIAIQTRYLGKSKTAPRFQFIGGSKPMMYNLPVLNNLEDGVELVITEGITDCLALLSEGKNAIAIPSATTIPIEQLRLLSKWKLSMAADHDKAGEKAFQTLRFYLIRMGSGLSKLDFPNQFKDYGAFHAELKDVRVNAKPHKGLEELTVDKVADGIIMSIERCDEEEWEDRLFRYKRQLANFLFGAITLKEKSKLMSVHTICEDDILLAFTYMLGAKHEFNFNWSYLLNARENLSRKLNQFSDAIESIIVDLNSLFQNLKFPSKYDFIINDVLEFTIEPSHSKIEISIIMSNFDNLLNLSGDKYWIKVVNNHSMIGTFKRERKKDDTDILSLSRLADKVKKAMVFFVS